MAANTGNTVRRWLRFRFSLRTLLVAMTVFSIWLGIALHKARVQKRSVDAFGINRVGYGYQYVGRYGVDGNRAAGIPAWLLNAIGKDFVYRVTYLNLDGAAASAPLLANLHGLPHLRFLGLDNGVVTTEVADDIGRMHDLELLSLQTCHISGEHIRRFKNLRNLKELHLSFDPIGDSGLEWVGQFTSLQLLQLEGTDITDDGLRHLAGLSNLEMLYLSQNKGLTNAGLKHLRTMTKLRTLSLCKDAQISDEGLAALRELPNLKTVDVSQTAVSKAGAEELERAMPGLKVVR